MEALYLLRGLLTGRRILRRFQAVDVAAGRGPPRPRLQEDAEWHGAAAALQGLRLRLQYIGGVSGFRTSSFKLYLVWCRVRTTCPTFAGRAGRTPTNST